MAHTDSVLLIQTSLNVYENRGYLRLLLANVNQCAGFNLPCIGK